MSRFNVKVQNKTTNLAGGQAFKQTEKLEFVSLLLTSFLKDKFYESANETLDRLKELYFGLNDKKFAAKAAIYARTKYGMRSISHVVAGEIAKSVKGEQWTRHFFDQIVYRPDDMMEILSYYFSTGNKSVPNSVKKGFAAAITKMNEYTLAKYRGEGKGVALVDVVNLVHPKANDSLNKLMKGELKSTETWESKLSATHGDTIRKAAVWKELVLEKKIGYFALLRNLRNIVQQCPEIINEVCELLVDETRIKKSLVFPFRFLTALKELEQISNTGKVLSALSKAVDISLNNVPKFEGKTLIALDTSGSMSGKPSEIGALFAAVLLKSNDNADLLTFEFDGQYRSVNTSDSTLTITKGLAFNGGGTNFHAIFDTANKAYDRIVILSDMQGWLGEGGEVPTRAYNNYKVKYMCNPKIFSFDLEGYGTLQFPEPDIYCLAGFSDKTMQLMKVLESDKKALIHEIEAINL